MSLLLFSGWVRGTMWNSDNKLKALEGLHCVIESVPKAL